MVEHLAEM